MVLTPWILLFLLIISFLSPIVIEMASIMTIWSGKNPNRYHRFVLVAILFWIAEDIDRSVRSFHGQQDIKRGVDNGSA